MSIDHSSLSPRQEIAVVFLWWIPQQDAEEHKRFLASYKRYEGGLPYTFYVVIKDGRPEENEAAAAYLKDQDIACNILYFSGGFDIDAFFFAATEIKAKYILYFNTGTQLITSNWLKSYMAPFYSSDKVALVGACASNQSLYSTVFFHNSLAWEAGKAVKHNVDKYKLLLKTFFYWRFLFRPFPNPHIRTNAFAVLRGAFLKVKKDKFRNKFDTFLFESGRKSLTFQLLDMGYKVAVADRSGNSYSFGEFKESNTFWINDQAGCLVADKQTELYRTAGAAYKAQLTLLAWGIIPER